MHVQFTRGRIKSNSNRYAVERHLYSELCTYLYDKLNRMQYTINAVHLCRCNAPNIQKYAYLEWLFLNIFAHIPEYPRAHAQSLFLPPRGGTAAAAASLRMLHNACDMSCLLLTKCSIEHIIVDCGDLYRADANVSFALQLYCLK